MNKNTLIGLLLLFALFIGYSWYMTPSKEERAESQRKADSIRMEYKAQQISDSISGVIAEQQTTQREFVNETPSTETDTAATYSKLASAYGAFVSASVERDDKPIVVENELYRLHIARKGGRIESVELKDILEDYYRLN